MLFNEYEMITLIKDRQMEIEKKIKNASRFYEESFEKRDFMNKNSLMKTNVNCNCECCA